MDLSPKQKELTEKFQGRSIYERHMLLLTTLTSIRRKLSTIESVNIEVFKNAVRVGELPADDEVNLYLNKLVGASVESIFTVVVKQEKSKKVKEYDPYILSISESHPDSYTREDLKEDMRDYFEDKQRES